MESRGARTQRVLWAGTGTKNPNYLDTVYVDQLIGPHTVNTLPPATVDAFLERGREAETLTSGVSEARAQIAKLADLGTDLDAITRQLQDNGVVAFANPFDALMHSIADKKESLKAA